MKLFKKKVKEQPEYDLDDLKKIKKKDRKKALKLSEEYKKGLVIQINKDINQKELMESIRKVN
jgi:hypothetical protein